jgi:hypothetical protein
MDFRRGLFRLWVILTIVFVGAVAAYGYRPVNKDLCTLRL